jgi:hypothetical protein
MPESSCACSLLENSAIIMMVASAIIPCLIFINNGCDEQLINT